MLKTTLVLVAAVALILPTAATGAWFGFAACSASDSGSSFWWDGQNNDHVVGEDVDLLPEGNYPYDAVMRPGDEEVWVAGASGDGVVVVDAFDNVVTTIAVGEYPVSIAFNPLEDIALVSCRDSDRLDIVDTDSYAVVGSLDIPGTYLGPGNIIFDPQGDRFFLVAWYDDILFEIAADGSAITNQVELGDNLWQLAIDPNFGGPLFVTDRGQDLLWSIDPETLTVNDSYPVGDDPWGVDVDEIYVVVVCEDSGDVYRIDAWSGDTQVLELPTGADPRDVNIVTGWVTVGQTVIMGAAYIAGGQIGGLSPVYVMDIFSGEMVDTIDMPGTNVNVVAVEAQWPLPTAVEDLPARAALTVQVAPNPFNPVTEVAYSLPAPGYCTVEVFDLAGRSVRRLFAGDQVAGSHRAQWDGRDDRGVQLASGTYLIRVEQGSRSSATKAVLVE